MKKFYDKKGFGLFVWLITSVMTIVFAWTLITPFAIAQQEIFTTPVTQIPAMVSLLGILNVVIAADFIMLYKERNDDKWFVKSK